MMSFAPAAGLWYWPDAVDMGLGFDGLFNVVRCRLIVDRLSGHLLHLPQPDGRPSEGPLVLKQAKTFCLSRAEWPEGIAVYGLPLRTLQVGALT
jgi:hypothetical protein